MAITYIVVTEEHYWGKAESLDEAMRNAHLVPWTRERFFSDELEAFGDMGMSDALKDAHERWNDYAKLEYQGEAKRKIRCTIYRFDDDEIWDDYSISHIDGSVTFHIEDKGSLSQQEVNEMFEQCMLKAWWRNGEIIART